jgi:drug/metabolite transporter (DMT)-like permease
MNEVSGAANAQAVAAKKKLSSSFFKKGITVAILSGMCYGLYSAFMTLGMLKGVWGNSLYAGFTAGGTVLTTFVMVYMLGALGSALNDTISGVWCVLIAAVKGKLGDFFRTLKTKPGAVMIVAALIGGPISSTAYVVSLQMAGSIIIPITALCPAIGAILGRVLFKQELNRRMVVGILICFGASLMIASTSLGGDAPEGRLLGIIIAFLAALGWGIEGCVAGYGTAMIDSEIGITIRQCVSGLTNLIILVPLWGIISGGGVGLAGELIGDVMTDMPSLVFFIISGFFSVYAYSLWYKGNSMCGAALGMACNGAFSFWGPFFCWIVIGIFDGQEGWALPPIAWAAAIVMVLGILVIAMNPMDLFRKKEA